jgi:hypothetical protein
MCFETVRYIVVENDVNNDIDDNGLWSERIISRREFTCRSDAEDYANKLIGDKKEWRRVQIRVVRSFGFHD